MGEEELLGRLGAVSAEVAAAMAPGRWPGRLKADLGLAITGVAGTRCEEGTVEAGGASSTSPDAFGARVKVVETSRGGAIERRTGRPLFNAALRASGRRWSPPPVVRRHHLRPRPLD